MKTFFEHFMCKLVNIWADVCSRDPMDHFCFWIHAWGQHWDDSNYETLFSENKSQSVIRLYWIIAHTGLDILPDIHVHFNKIQEID